MITKGSVKSIVLSMISGTLHANFGFIQAGLKESVMHSHLLFSARPSM